MSRLNKAEEIIELAMMFQNSYCGLCIDDIQEHFECSRRSAERMKSLLFDLFPDKVEEVPTSDKKKRWRFKKGTMNWLINFTSADFANLEQCKKSFKSPIKQKEIDELIEKIKALNPENISDVDIDEILSNQAYVIRQGFRENIKLLPLETLQLLNNSILCQKPIRINYYDQEYTLNPYGILYSDRAYLIAYNIKANAIWTFRVSKIKEITLTDNYFEKEDNFDLKEYCARSFGVFQGEIFDVVLQFNKDAAQDAKEYFFHPTQIGKLEQDGSYTLSLKASGEYEIITELLKWRDSVKILAPESLKEAYKNEIRKMYENIKD